MPVVVLSGTPEERGTAYGEAVGPMIKDNLGRFWEEAKAKGLDKGAMAARAISLSSSMPDHMITEIRAMAAASGSTSEVLPVRMGTPEVVESGHPHGVDRHLPCHQVPEVNLGHTSGGPLDRIGCVYREAFGDSPRCTRLLRSRACTSQESKRARHRILQAP